MITREILKYQGILKQIELVAPLTGDSPQVIFTGRKIISSKSKKQSMVAQSSLKVEYTLWPLLNLCELNNSFKY